MLVVLGPSKAKAPKPEKQEVPAGE
jgi:hypothetical protein